MQVINTEWGPMTTDEPTKTGFYWVQEFDFANREWMPGFIAAMWFNGEKKLAFPGDPTGHAWSCWSRMLRRTVETIPEPERRR
jgi:hypothetical protein